MQAIIDRENRWAKLFVGVGVAVTLLVFVLRTYYSLGTGDGAFFLTSGAEEESWYAVWKFVHGQPVYVDFHKVPFAASYFNWGFYLFYGGITKACLALFGLGDEWIPTIGRAVTFAGCLLGFFVSVRIARLLVHPVRLSFVQTSLLLLFFGGYLMGFWAVTVRPDVWALTLELIALYYFMRYWQARTLSLLLASFLFFYLAWAFKQNFFGLLAGCGLFLLLQKRFVTAIALALAFAAAGYLTYAVGTSDYQYMMVTSQLRMKMSLAVGLENLKLALVKSLPFVLTAGIVFLISWRQIGFAKMVRSFKQNHWLQLSIICFAVSFVLFFVMAMKDGAADNYFFTPIISLAFVLILVVHKLALTQRRPYNAAVMAIALVCLLNAGEGFFILTERFGRSDPGSDKNVYMAAKSVMDSLPKPVYFEKDNLANVPWINKSEKNFILATTYYYKDLYGDSFERGGVEGLMREGYFNAIVDEGYPVADLKEKYILSDSVVKNDHRFFIWRKKP